MKVLFHARGSKELLHTIHYHFDGRAIWNIDRQRTKVVSCDLSSVEDILWYYLVSNWVFLFTIECRFISTYSSNYYVHAVTCLHEFRRSCQCSIFIHLDECNFFILVPQCSYKKIRMSRGGRLLLYGNSKGCEVAEHISTKVEANPRMLSTLKNAKSIWSMNPGGDFETSMIGPLIISVALVRKK